ncbi:alpha/beta hydrolase [Photobacterium japonica]|uniref:alpha/beta hydrolase n=1 Tax=Photobacterium japonica TaxID=2910235 RepID=UPI003D10BFE3
MPALPLALQTWLAQFNLTVAQSLAMGVVPTPALARLGLQTITQQFAMPSPSIDTVIDTLLLHTSVPCRIYHPEPQRALPVILFFHGGGHMCGSSQVYDPICQRIATTSQHIVVSVDYRLAPEHPYPLGLNDCMASLTALHDTLTAQPFAFLPSVTLMGDSAGGALATTLAQQSHLLNNVAQRGMTVEHLVLIYPSLDYTLSSPSITQLQQGYLLESSKVLWYFDHYFQRGEDRQQASPLFRPLNANHPSTMIITAGFDPLRDEGRRYADRLTQHHIACEHLHMEDMIHAYLNLDALAPDACEHTYQAIAAYLAPKGHEIEPEAEQAQAQAQAMKAERDTEGKAEVKPQKGINKGAINRHVINKNGNKANV